MKETIGHSALVVTPGRNRKHPNTCPVCSEPKLARDEICSTCAEDDRLPAIAEMLGERILKLERWREQVFRYLPSESDCSTCRFARIEGSRDTSGGNEAQGYDQTGCDQPLLVETYTRCEPAGMLLEGLMIKQAESAAGCPWQEVKK